MRQVGILAAAGLHALDHHVDRLADDHARAKRLAEVVAEGVAGSIDPGSVETNIVVLEVPDAARVMARCREQDVLVGALDSRHLRAVTHLDVDDEAVDRAARVLVSALRA
jgi:threonine aldolase